MTHRNAFLTPRGRLALAQCVVDDKWTLRRAGERFNCSAATAQKWADRYRAGGEAAMEDRSSRPHHCPNQLGVRRERRIIKVRFTKRCSVPPRCTTELECHYDWRTPMVFMLDNRPSPPDECWQQELQAPQRYIVSAILTDPAGKCLDQLDIYQELQR